LTVTLTLVRVPLHSRRPPLLQCRGQHRIPQATFFRCCSSLPRPLVGTTLSRSISNSFSSQSNSPRNSTKSIILPTTKITMTITLELLQQQNAETSNALMDHWKDSTKFDALAQREGALTLARDEEDGTKLQVGIDYAKSKGVIDPNYIPEPYVTIDVLGKTPEQVADEMLSIVEQGGDDVDATKGSVIVLCGLSGTGKVCMCLCLCVYCSGGML
jgi:hypothetical protein